MKKILTIISIVFFATILLAQSNKGKVGITNVSNTNFAPQAALDVDGKTYANNLYLKDPGEPTITGGSFLASHADMQVRNSYDTPLTKYGTQYGLFNYIHLNFNDVGREGVKDYNTKISTTDYVLVVHNYAFKNTDGSTTVALNFNPANDRQGSPNITAYKHTDGFWHLTARFTNSTFRKLANENAADKFNIELIMMAYRYLITKQNINEISVDLNGANGSSSNTGVPKPTGF